MMRQISEPDWRLFRQVHAIALDRFCQGVLSEIGRRLADPAGSAPERYRALYRLIEQRDKELAEAFDDLRRTTAWRQLAILRSRSLVTDEEIARFSPETQGAVAVWLGVDPA